MPNQTDGGQPVFNERVLTLLAYFPFLCIIPLLVKKDDAFVLAHGKQGLVIFVAEVGVFILSIILPAVIMKVGMFVLLVLAFMGMLAVLNGKTVQLPVVSRLAEKIIL